MTKVRTSIPNGEKIHNCEIPDRITVEKNGEALATILEPITLDFSEPILLEQFNKLNFEEILCNKFERSTKPKFDTSKIRFDHLNSEGKSQIS